MIDFNNKNVRWVLIIGVLVIVISVIGFSYAYFSLDVIGEGTNNLITSGNYVLNFDDISTHEVAIIPGDYVTKTFTVKNKSDSVAYYDIGWESLINEFDKGDIHISLACTRYDVTNTTPVVSGTCDSVADRTIPELGDYMLENVYIEQNVMHSYSTTITFADTSRNQDYNKNKTFNGVIGITANKTPRNWYSNCTLSSTDLKCKIINNNSLTADNVSSTYVTSSTGIDFSEVNSPTNGQGLYTDRKYGGATNAYFRGGTYCAYNNYNIETDSGTYCTASGGVWDSTYHCSLDDSKSSCESAGFTYYELNNNLTFGGYAWKIIRIDEEGNIRLLYNGTTTTSRDSSAYISPSVYNAQAMGDNRSVGYMYGTIDIYSTVPVIGTADVSKTNINASTNYCYSKDLIINPTTGEMSLDSPTCALFSGTYADGTYYTLWNTDPSATSRIYSYRIESYESSTSCNFRYVSVVAENTGNEFDNDIDSTIKSKVDDWYNTNMSSNTSKLADAGYCNDRSIYSGTGIGSSATQYKAYYARSTMPKYICENSVRDLFTLTDSTKGNKKLTYPVGLLSSDEITYGGTVYSNSGNGSYHSYLHIGNYYWTMSPFNFFVARARASCRDVHAYGGSYTEGANGYYGVRPVIALKPDSLYVSGNGSVDTPYVVN